MAEMLIQSETLTAIADKIRVLSGTEEAMGLDDMAEHVGEASADVATEADLIEQIAGVLEGKAGNGEVVEVTLQSKTVTPTTSQQVVTYDSGYNGLDVVTINAIPSNYVVPSGAVNITANGTHDVKNYASAVVKIAGSGGSSIETCTVTIEYYNADFGNGASSANVTIYSSVLDSNGNIQPVTLQSGVDFVFEEGMWGSCSATIVLENVAKNSILAIVDNSNTYQTNTDFNVIKQRDEYYIRIFFINQDGYITIN